MQQYMDQHSARPDSVADVVGAQSQEEKESQFGSKAAENAWPSSQTVPEVVEAWPRDTLVASSDYTLTREDQLRQSIKLKESSLI